MDFRQAEKPCTEVCGECAEPYTALIQFENIVDSGYEYFFICEKCLREALALIEKGGR